MWLPLETLVMLHAAIEAAQEAQLEAQRWEDDGGAPWPDSIPTVARQTPMKRDHS